MIRKRNLDNSLIQWIMTVTGLGPGIGEMHWAAPAASATSQFRTQLQKQGVERDYEIHTLPSLAYANMVTNRNDVMLVMPGKYTQPVTISWAKSQSHIIGLGGPQTAVPVGVTNPSYYLEIGNPASGGAATGVYVLDITGEYCQFINLSVQNLFNSAACLGAVRVRGEGNYFKNVNMVGGTAATPAATDKSCSLEIGDDAGCSRFDDCNIGTPHGTVRSSASNGALYFSGIARRSPRGWFNRCNFYVRSDTSAASIIRDDGCDRSWIFNDCYFENFSSNYANALAECIHENAFATTHAFIFRRCTLVGVTVWCTNQSGYPHYTLSDMPAADTGGGIVRALEGTVFAGSDR